MRWDDLNMADKSRMMQLAINSGITDLRTIREVYNSYAEGGPVKNYKNWKEQIERYKGINTNDLDYDYEGFYNENPRRAWQMLKDNPKAHFTDKYKTESHPTLSNESIYANGRGGTWGNGTFELSDYLMNNSDRTLDYLRRNDPDIIPTYRGGIVLDSSYINGNDFAEGGKIHIKPENRGKFTALKKRTGKSASWFKAHGTPAQRKMATFALNARKWKHAYGGHLFDEGGEETAIQEVPPPYTDFGLRKKWDRINNGLVAAIPIIPGAAPAATFMSALRGLSDGLEAKRRAHNQEVIMQEQETPEEIQYKTLYDATPEEIEAANLTKRNGTYNINSYGDKGDKHYDVVEARARGLLDGMRRNGFTEEEVERLSPFLLSQLVLEGGWVVNRDDNNFGGMLNPGTKEHIPFDSEESFYDSYLKNLDKRWGDEVMGEGKGWRSAKDIKQYTDIINREDLGLHTKADYDRYKIAHPKDSVYIYTPLWDNKNKSLMEFLEGIYPRVYGTYDLLKTRQAEFDKFAKHNNLVK